MRITVVLVSYPASKMTDTFVAQFFKVRRNSLRFAVFMAVVGDDALLGQVDPPAAHQ
jgi:hypothetical protein